MRKISPIVLALLYCLAPAGAKEWPSKIKASPLEVRLVRTKNKIASPTEAERSAGTTIGTFDAYSVDCGGWYTSFVSLEDVRKVVKAAGWKDINATSTQLLIDRNPTGQIKCTLLELDPTTKGDAYRGVGIIHIKGQPYYELEALKGLFGGMASYEFRANSGKPQGTYVAVP